MRYRVYVNYGFGEHCIAELTDFDLGVMIVEELRDRGLSARME